MIYVARLETFNFVTYVVAVAACVAGVVGAGSSDELGYDTVLGACALLLVAAIAFLSEGDCGGGPSTFQCSAYPLLALLPALVVFHVLQQKVRKAETRTQLLPDFGGAALVLALSCLPFAIAVVVQNGRQIIHNIVKEGRPGSGGRALHAECSVILLMECGLVYGLLLGAQR